MARLVLMGWKAVAPRRDVLAGLTVWAVLVPESLAYATIAGVPPVVGLYAAVPSLLVYALLGSSRHLVVALMSATAALSAGAILLLQRASRPNVPALRRTATGVWVDASTTSGATSEHGSEPAIAVVRIEAGLFFANAEHVRERILAETGPGIHAVVIAGVTTPTVDLTAALMLDELASTLDARGVRLALAQAVGQVRDVLDRTAPEAVPIYPTVDEAVAALRTPVHDGPLIRVG